uniref:Serine/threonine-protein kinase 19 homolog isoform X2 n=1 Tax=Rhizophora mucronata TaxID=61149 RepID=A0A2P2K7U8_RHIMU
MGIGLSHVRDMHNSAFLTHATLLLRICCIQLCVSSYLPHSSFHRNDTSGWGHGVICANSVQQSFQTLKTTLLYLKKYISKSVCFGHKCSIQYVGLCVIVGNLSKDKTPNYAK